MADGLVGQDSSVLNESRTLLDCCSISSVVFVSRRSTVWLEYRLRHMKQLEWALIYGGAYETEWALIYGGAYLTVRMGFDLWLSLVLWPPCSINSTFKS